MVLGVLGSHLKQTSALEAASRAATFGTRLGHPADSLERQTDRRKTVCNHSETSHIRASLGQSWSALISASSLLGSS